jgi:hypothetical protein
MGALLLHFRGMNGGGIVHGNDAKSLHAAIALFDKADHASAFKSSLEAVSPQARNVKEDIAWCTAVRQDEAIALGDIEPLYRPRDFDQPNSLAALIPAQGAVRAQFPPHERGLVPHPNAPFPRKRRH